ncbi:biliverdin-producing heme oxygenase [Enemella dayhoffiae]|uniref:biliverdin-producing heme oxygenase n=1 Tax=Enemella dayhoffiae TaxID=2016507 RepID=UPI001E3B705E|nr:biliverdin-producing heme oxygenase [Enemella dayhoffiae]
MTTRTEPITLSAALREHTADAHQRAEESTFVVDLLAGRLSLDALVALLAQSLPIYAALEETCRAADSPILAPLLDPRLERTERLRADLAAHAAAGRRFETVLPSAEAYAAELRSLADRPAALLAHHYVRYLGDLSGGQVIASLVQRHYGADPGALTFYRFEIERPKVYKDDYRPTRRAAAER